MDGSELKEKKLFALRTHMAKVRIDTSEQENKQNNKFIIFI